VKPRKPPRRRAFWRAVRALVTALLLLLIAPATAGAGGLRALVDPFTGTGGRSPHGDPGLQEFPGSTFPGASVPFGMVQLSPDTERPGGAEVRQAATGGYRWTHGSIRGFSHQHLSGAGCNGKRTFGDVPFLPTVGPVAPRPGGLTEPVATGLNGSRTPIADRGNEVREAGRQVVVQPFRHEREGATPGHYWVDLPGVRAELTATRRTGWHRYTFVPSPQANVLMDVGTSLANYGTEDAELRMVSDRRVEGSVSFARFCGASRYTVYFAAEFDRPFAGVGAWQGAVPEPGRREARGRTGGGWVSFDTTRDRDVVVKVGLSYVSVEGARGNLAAETREVGFDFDRVRREAARAWDDWLDRVDVDGGTGQQRATFATALYQAALHPNVHSDADGRYRGPDGVVRRAEGREVYTQFSLWDSYRSHVQLLALLDPARARDMVRSMLGMRRDGGWLPKWALAGQDSGNMFGDPVTLAVIDGWAKGLLSPAEGREAWALLRENATTLPPAGQVSRGREYLDAYRSIGYVPLTPRDGRSSAMTLEYALADCAMARIARARGDRAAASAFARQAGHWRNVLNPATRTMGPRAPDGTFTSADPASEQGFVDSALQWTWHVQHDVAGLAAALGGTGTMEQRLDAFFALGEVLEDPERAARKAWNGPLRVAPADQPMFHTPWLYAWLDEPWKTSPVVRAWQTLVRTGPNGLPGNEDLGASSAWYALSALGLFPAVPGQDGYVLNAPLFERARVRLDRRWYRSGRLEVRASGASAARRFVRRVRVGGREHRSPWLAHDVLRRGARLRFDLAGAPVRSWGRGGARPPSGC